MFGAAVGTSSIEALSVECRREARMPLHTPPCGVAFMRREHKTELESHWTKGLSTIVTTRSRYDYHSCQIDLMASQHAECVVE